MACFLRNTAEYSIIHLSMEGSINNYRDVDFREVVHVIVRITVRTKGRYDEGGR